MWVRRSRMRVSLAASVKAGRVTFSTVMVKGEALPSHGTGLSSRSK